MPEAADVASGITSLLLSRTAFSQAKVSVYVCVGKHEHECMQGVFLFTSSGRELPQPPRLPANLIPVFCKPWKYEDF